MSISIKPLAAGVAAGVALAAGGVAAFEIGSEGATAQSPSDPVTQSDLDAANLRSQRAIKQATSVWNFLGKYLAPDGTLITAKGPRVSQQAGTGSGGLPTGTISDGAITTAKLSTGVQGQLNTIYTAAVSNSPGQPPTITNTKGATAVTRTPALPTGAFDVDFGTNNLSQCTWTSSVGTTAPGAFTPVFAPFIPYATLLDSNTLRVFTFNGAGALADAPFQVHVIC